MAKSKVTKTGTAKASGKAVTRALVNTQGVLGKVPTSLTEEDLDKRQLAKGTKRKQQGPKLKKSINTGKPPAAMINKNVPPTDVG